MSLVCIDPPAVAPVSLDELKEFLRVDASDTSQDNAIAGFAAAAVATGEAFTKRRFVKQAWRLYLDFFPGYIDMKLAGAKVSSPFVSGANAILVGIRYAIALPQPPVRRLLRFVYQNANGNVTSMITGALEIAAVSNAAGAAVGIETRQPHGLVTGAAMQVAGNAALAAVLPSQALQVATVTGPTTLTVNGSVGTGTPIAGGGTLTGYAFVQDLQSNPARLTPLFGQMWPVARVVVNAIEIDYELGYAQPITVKAAGGSKDISSPDYTFASADVGRPISIRGAGAPNNWAEEGSTLNTVIASVSEDGATLRDKAATDGDELTALLVNTPSGNPTHWAFIQQGIKAYVAAKFEQRLGDSQAEELLQGALYPMRDMRY